MTSSALWALSPIQNFMWYKNKSDIVLYYINIECNIISNQIEGDGYALEDIDTLLNC